MKLQISSQLLSKIFEKIIANRLLNFLTTNSIIYENQFGFRKGHSSAMAVITLVDFISTAIDNKEFPIEIFTDPSKAFDTLNHKILITKLEHIGIRGPILALLQNYLEDRTQCVFYNGTLSDSLPITCGVPQGSILGPLNFLLYINDLKNTSTLLKFIPFAVDTTFYFSSSNLTHLIQTINTELKHVAEWFKINKLSLNVSKTNFVLFKKNSISIPLDPPFIDNLKIAQVSNTKFLGVEINDNLNWHSHMSSIEKNYPVYLV